MFQNIPNPFAAAFGNTAFPLWNTYVQTWAVPVAQFHQSIAAFAQWPIAGFGNPTGVDANTIGEPQPSQAVFSTADHPLAPLWQLAGFPCIETRIEPASADRPFAKLTLVSDRDSAITIAKTPAAKSLEKTAAKPAAASVAIASTEPADVAPAPRQFAKRPETVDTLRYIYGVGPALEKLLHKNGIYQFRQVASWTKEDIAFFDERLERFRGRIERDSWIRSAIEEHYKKYGEWLGIGKPRITLPETNH